jgi:hypothetical protein
MITLFVTFLILYLVAIYKVYTAEAGGPSPIWDAIHDVGSFVFPIVIFFTVIILCFIYLP